MFSFLPGACLPTRYQLDHVEAKLQRQRRVSRCGLLTSVFEEYAACKRWDASQTFDTFVFNQKEPIHNNLSFSVEGFVVINGILKENIWLWFFRNLGKSVCVV